MVKINSVVGKVAPWLESGFALQSKMIHLLELETAVCQNNLVWKLLYSQKHIVSIVKRGAFWLL